jgi:NADPH:quinone reductase
MRAIQIQRFGGPDVLELAELPRPETGPGQLLVKVERAGINWADMGAREDSYLSPQELPLVPGLEVAGTVVEGDGVFEPAERVAAIVPNGGYAEYAAVFSAAATRIPEHLDAHTALALLVQGITAWHLCYTCGRIGPGESVVVGAGAGGVGTLAIQLARSCDAGRIIALAGSEEKRQLCKTLGADDTVDSRQEDVGQAVLEANEGKMVDVIFEMTGGQVFRQLLETLAPFGRLVTYGAAGGNLTDSFTQLTASDLISTGRGVIGFWLALAGGNPRRFKEPLEDLLGRVSRGELKVQNGGTYPLEKAAEAHRNLASRATTGKLVLDLTA